MSYDTENAKREMRRRECYQLAKYWELVARLADKIEEEHGLGEKALIEAHDRSIRSYDRLWPNVFTEVRNRQIERASARYDAAVMNDLGL